VLSRPQPTHPPIRRLQFAQNFMITPPLNSLDKSDRMKVTWYSRFEVSRRQARLSISEDGLGPGLLSQPLPHAY
jgi:hypothetical protein